MKKDCIGSLIFSCLVLAGLCFSVGKVHAQGCVNADFSQGNFNGWTGTYSEGQCSGTGTNGHCSCSPTNPDNTAGFNQGPNDAPANDPNNEWNQIITTTAGGNDPLIAGFGYNLPTVWPGNGYSARIGNMWQDVSPTKTGDGESISYSFVVTPSNSNFTYHYAVVLSNGNHTPGQQAFFDITMVAGGNPVACAAYNVDATTAATIGGFSNSNDSIFWKPWSSVVVPLSNYIGQTVTITFTTRGCIPKGCAGKHFAYAYISAECAPLILTTTSTVDCGQNDTLTGPAGSATYSWSGPGIVGSSSNQSVIIDEPGEYVVSMTTFGNTPCGFSLDTLIAGTNLHANFSVPITCTGSPTTFTDLSTSSAAISSWSWNFGDGDTSTAQNPTHTFANTGTFPVTLTVVSAPCTKQITINVTVTTPPTSTFVAPSPVCEGTNSHITYTGNAPAGYNYTWNFDGGTGVPVTGEGPLNISWQTPGIKTITLVVSAGSCFSAPDTQQVLVKPYPGMTLTPYTAICAGDSTTLMATNCTVYNWAPDPSLSNTDSAVVIVAPLVTTTYSVTGSNTNCISVDTVTVAVIPVPTSTFTALGPVCIGQNTTITYTGNGVAGAIYNWNFDGGTATPDTGQGPLQINWLIPGTEYIALTVTQQGCPSTTVDSVVVFAKPPTPLLAADTFIGCPNLDVCFTSSTIGNALGYNWNFSDGGSSDEQNPCHLFVAPGSYSVNYQVNLSPECVYDTTMLNLITVIDNPTAAFTTSAITIQLPSQDTIDLYNRSYNAVSYLWTLGALGNSMAFEPQVVLTEGATYPIVLRAYNQLGCVDSVGQTVYVLSPVGYYIPNIFSPNGSGYNDQFYIFTQAGVTVVSFEVFDRWGEKVHEGTYPWDGSYKGKPLPQAVYVYYFELQLQGDNHVVESKGSVTLLR